MPFTTSIMPSSAAFGRAVRKPACPSIDFSIKALQGQTVTQWPQETQLDSPIVEPPSHSTRGIRIFPVDGKRFVDLDILASLNTAPAEDALLGIASVKRIRAIDRVRLWPKRDLLVLDRQQLGRVMGCAVAI